MPEVSILLPSLRHTCVLKRIEEFDQMNSGVDYEIIIVSPFIVEGNKVVHIAESEPKGNVYAQNLAYKNSSGKYIVNWTDDISPTPNCLAEMLNFVKDKPDPFIGVFGQKLVNGEELPQWSIYGKLQACWGCASRTTIEMIGGYLYPAFKSFWSDPDLSLRVWEKGGTVKVCPKAWLIIAESQDVENVTSRNASMYWEKDTETFFNRWHEKLGKGMPKDTSVINQALPLSWRGTLVKKKIQLITVKVQILIWLKSTIGSQNYQIVRNWWYVIQGKTTTDEKEKK